MSPRIAQDALETQSVDRPSLSSSRRDVMKKAAVGGAVLWVAPAVLALDTQPAAASPNCAGQTASGQLAFPGSGSSAWTAAFDGFSGMGGVNGYSNATYITLPAPNFRIEQDAVDRSVRSTPNPIPLAGFTATAYATYCRNLVLCGAVHYRFSFQLVGRNVNPRDQLFWVSLSGTALPMGGLPGSPRTSVLATDVADGGPYYSVTTDFTPAANGTYSFCFNHALRSGGGGSSSLVSDDFGETAPTLSIIP